MRLLGPPKPYFFQSLDPGFFTKFSIPKHFLEHLKQDEEDGVSSKKSAKLRDKGGRTWDVKVDYDSLTFTDGWEKFCRSHGLQVGHFLVFRYGGDWVFEVFIFDHAVTESEFFPVLNESRTKSKSIDSASLSIPSEPCNVAPGANKKILNLTGPSNPGITSDAAHNGQGMVKIEDEEHPKSKSFKYSGYPYFHHVVKPYCFNGGSCFIPMEFGSENGLRKRWCDMVLIDEGGKSWPMKLRHMNTSRPNGGNPYICGGWSAFLKAHELNGGDHLIFELIDSGDKPIMKVYTCEEIINCPFIKAEEMIESRKVTGKRKRSSKQKNCVDSFEMSNMVAATEDKERKPKISSKQKRICETNIENKSDMASMAAVTEDKGGKHRISSEQNRSCETNCVHTSEMANMVPAAPEDKGGKRKIFSTKKRLCETNGVDTSEMARMITATEENGKYQWASMDAFTPDQWKVHKRSSKKKKRESNCVDTSKVTSMVTATEDEGKYQGAGMDELTTEQQKAHKKSSKQKRSRETNCLGLSEVASMVTASEDHEKYQQAGMDVLTTEQWKAERSSMQKRSFETNFLHTSEMASMVTEDNGKYQLSSMDALTPEQRKEHKRLSNKKRSCETNCVDTSKVASMVTATENEGTYHSAGMNVLSAEQRKAHKRSSKHKRRFETNCSYTSEYQARLLPRKMT